MKHLVISISRTLGLLCSKAGSIGVNSSGTNPLKVGIFQFRFQQWVVCLGILPPLDSLSPPPPPIVRYRIFHCLHSPTPQRPSPCITPHPRPPLPNLLPSHPPPPTRHPIHLKVVPPLKCLTATTVRSGLFPPTNGPNRPQPISHVAVDIF